MDQRVAAAAVESWSVARRRPSAGISRCCPDRILRRRVRGSSSA